MRKKYPRKSRLKRFRDYYISPMEMITDSTIAVDRQIYPLISDVVNSTKKELCLAFFQMTLDENHLVGLPLSIFSSLKSRLDDGVNIKVILNQKFANAIQRELNSKTIKLLKSVGIDVKWADPRSVVHAKLIISDGEKAVVGSMNMTATSLADNFEVAVYLKSPLVKDVLSPYFENLWQRGKD